MQTISQKRINDVTPFGSTRYMMMIVVVDTPPANVCVCEYHRSCHHCGSRIQPCINQSNNVIDRSVLRLDEKIIRISHRLYLFYLITFLNFPRHTKHLPLCTRTHWSGFYRGKGLLCHHWCSCFPHWHTLPIIHPHFLPHIVEHTYIYSVLIC